MLLICFVRFFVSFFAYRTETQTVKLRSPSAGPPEQSIETSAKGATHPGMAMAYTVSDMSPVYQ